jgi:hypothetical protein
MHEEPKKAVLVVLELMKMFKMLVDMILQIGTRVERPHV